MCREAAGSCDLPEFCTGASPYCPANVYLLDGSSCAHGQAYCSTGMCLSHQQQCLQLWGPGQCPLSVPSVPPLHSQSPLGSQCWPLSVGWGWWVEGLAQGATP